MFGNCILFATFCSMGPLVRRKKTWRYSAQKVMEFGQLMIDILVYVSCKFEMYIFNIAKVVSENIHIAFLYVLSIYFSTKQCAYQEILGISWFVCVILTCRDMFTLTLSTFLYYFSLKSNIIPQLSNQSRK